MSNIEIVTLPASGFTLPPGCRIIDGLENGIKEGKIKVYNENSELYAELMYVHDKLNGISCFYVNGRINKKITYVNGKEDGWACDYDGNVELQNYLYEKGEKKYKINRIEGKEGLWREEDLQTNSLVSICSYNANFKKKGNCYCYKDDAIVEYAIYKNDGNKTIYKTFQENMMKEYNDNNKVIYEGEYENSLDKNYPRNGNGKEFQENEKI